MHAPHTGYLHQNYMHTEKKNKVIALLICAVMFLSMFSALFAVRVAASDDLSDKKNEMEALEAQLNALQDELEVLAADKQNQQAAQANATEQLEIVEAQIVILLDNISNKKGEIAKKQSEIDITLQNIAESEELLAERLRAMYITRNSGVMSTILSANSFSEFLTAADAVSRVTEADNLLLEEMDKEKKALQLQEEALASQLLDLEEEERVLEEARVNYATAWQVATDNIDTIAAAEAATAVEEAQIAAQYDAAKAEYEKAFLDATAGSIGDFVGGTFAWPVPSHSSSANISSPYAERYIFGRWEFHTGIDIATGPSASIYNAPIIASNDGVVVTAIYSNVGYGNYLMVDHGGQYITLYGHCNSLAVSNGSVVTKGQTIAYVGSTGNSTGNHLHFEIRINNQHTNPLPYLVG